MQDGDISGNWGSYSEEPGWARSHAQGPSEFGEIPRWGVPLGPLQVVVSILYAIASFLLFNVLGRRTVLYLEASCPFQNQLRPTSVLAAAPYHCQKGSYDNHERCQGLCVPCMLGA